jgi:23S rRNA pseudouridine1911/1915/1917 synthase
MEESRQFTFDYGRPPERLDRFLAERMTDLTRSQVKRLIEEGRVFLNGAAAKAGANLKGGEILTVSIPVAAPAEAIAQPIPLTILYEDSHLVVIDKSAGMVVHPAPGHSQGTLVNALLHHCRDLAGIGGELRPGIVHRLDRDTSGVLVVAKNEMALNHLAEQFHRHSVNRRYVALLHGSVQNERGTIDRSIGRHPTERKKMSGRGTRGRRAVTHWRVLRRFDLDRLTQVELVLETGRTHQIRVHLSEMNLPVVGDPVYGGTGRARGLTDLELRKRVQQLHRQFLHARLLGFTHPATGEYMEFESPLPAELQGILDYLEGKYQEPGVGS